MSPTAAALPDLTLASTATRTVECLRETQAALGADRFAAVLAKLSQAALRATLSRLDPHRTGISRMRRAELVCLLDFIGEGGALVRADDDVEPIGAVRFSVMSERDIAAMLARGPFAAA